MEKLPKGIKELQFFELGCVFYQASLGDFATYNEVEQELDKNGYSDTLVECLDDRSIEVELFARCGGEDRQNEPSIELLHWVKALETYINVNRDTPSCSQLWKWANPDIQDSRLIGKQLEEFGVNWGKGEPRFDGKEPMSKRSFDKFFERHIKTKSSQTPERKRRRALILAGEPLGFPDSENKSLLE